MATETDGDNQVILITGGTSGIGKYAAIALARQGATVTVVGRDRSRGEAALAEIKLATGSKSVDLLLADLSSQIEIRRLADEFKAKHDHLDVLINNAGVLYPKRILTADGIEATFATNHLAYFLLTNLMLPLLKKTPGSRVINVASDAHKFSAFDLKDPQSENGYSGMGAYSRSKAANIMFTYELARRLGGSGVTANALHPGAVNTSLFRRMSAIGQLLITLAKPFLRSPEKGAETIVYLASSPEVRGVTGKYFKDRRPIPSSSATCDGAAGQGLWEISEEMTHAG